MIFDEHEYTEQNIPRDEFYDSLRKVYAYLKQDNRINGEDCRYEITEWAGNCNSWAGKQITIPMEECISCRAIYFHNPGDCGLDEGEGLAGDEGSEWICSFCLDKRIESNIIPFDQERKKLRDEKKNELISVGVNIEIQDICCICQDELIICEVEDCSGRIDKNKTFVCSHSMCGKCYFDYENNARSNTEKSHDVIFCPLCKTVVSHITIAANKNEKDYSNKDFYDYYNYKYECENEEENEEELIDLKRKCRNFAIRMRKNILIRIIESKYEMVQRGFYHYYTDRKEK